MAKTPYEIVSIFMIDLPIAADAIENLCDTELDINYRGTPIIIDIENELSTLNDTEANIVINLVRLKYPKWKIDYFTSHETTKHRYLRFNAIDFSQ